MSTSHPPIPAKLKAFQHDKERKTRQDWDRYIRQVIKDFQKMERREEDEGMLSAYDLSGAMLRRKTEAILNTMPVIYERYQTLTEATPNALGEEWVSLNIPLCSYSFEEAQSHLLYAAALWILDHIDVEEAWPFLPTEESALDGLYGPDVWDAQHDEELILSVQYVLENRNGPPELSSRDYKRVITDRASAEGTQRSGERHRLNFEGLIALLPEALIWEACAQFEALFWQWTDQYFHSFQELAAATDVHRREYEELRVQFNALIDELDAAVKEQDREEREQKQKKKQKPLAVLAPQAAPPFPFSDGPLSPALEPVSKSKRRIALIAKRLYTKHEELDAAFKKLDKSHDREQSYIHSQIGPGGGTPLSLDAVDPYALCFALLYLIDTGSDLPWLYGPGVMLVEQITERLPWGVIEYDIDEDKVWYDDGETPPYTGKPSVQPDWYDRKYKKKDDFFPRSLVQLLYEETGCLMPRDLHLYDCRAKELGRYGVRGKDTQLLLTCMAALSHAKHQNIALNLRTWDDEAPVESAESGEDSKELKAEIRRLKAALHVAEQAAKGARQELEAAKKQSAQERRELADLRELVFSQEQEEAREEEEPQLELPYTVVKETLIFGGHDTWLKAIKPMLKGNVRFIDRSFLFDTSIIRRAEVLWIQTNALSHKQYYRIIDTARQFKKPVRYFANASALKCAAQLIENDGA